MLLQKLLSELWFAASIAVMFVYTLKGASTYGIELLSIIGFGGAIGLMLTLLYMFTHVSDFELTVWMPILI